MEPLKHMFTVWEFRGVTVPDRNVVVRHSEPFEPQHEYQRILWRGWAWNKDEALHLWKMARRRKA